MSSGFIAHREQCKHPLRPTSIASYLERTVMPRSRSAKIALPSRVELDLEIANLSESSVFVKTTEPLRFGDRVVLTLFNVPVRATVAFVSGDLPRGAVLVFT